MSIIPMNQPVFENTMPIQTTPGLMRPWPFLVHRDLPVTGKGFRFINAKMAPAIYWSLISRPMPSVFFSREGSPEDPHNHLFLRSVTVSAMESDGSEITPRALGPKFPNGLFVAMSEGRVFHYYRVEDILGELLTKPNHP